MALKNVSVTLAGRDAGTVVTIREHAALVADRMARNVLRQLALPLEGGVVSLALQYRSAVGALGERALPALSQFVDYVGPAPTIRDWRSYGLLHEAALALHAGFLVGRELLEIPVAMQSQQIMSGSRTVRATFCSPLIASVLDSGRASYHELETVLSTEDVFNVVEILNVRAIQDWYAATARQK